MNKRNYSIYIILLSSLMFLNILIFRELYIPINRTIKYKNIIYNGVSVNGIDISKKTFDEALDILEKNLNNQILKSKVYFKLGDELYVEDAKRFNIHYDIYNLVNNALSYGKNGKSIIKRTVQRINTCKNEYKIIPIIKYDYKSIEMYYEELSSKIDRKPKDARIYFDKNKIIIENEVNGLEIEKEKFIDITKYSFIQGEFNIDIPINVLIPKMTSSMISGKVYIISSFSTPILTKNKNRTNNIIIAASYVNGTIVYPGEIFSAHKAIGPRTYERGYTDAPIFVGKRVVPGIAGGICQLVTTIYNAALNSRMKIVERRRHSMPVAYAPPGLDATIAGSSVDLKFMNTKKFPVYVEAFIKDERVCVNIYEIR